MSSPLDDITMSTVHLLAKGQVHRIFGPPGTGKSSRLRDMIKDLVIERGPDSVIVTSFTVTAARHIAGMVNLPDRSVGTLHSLAYRALGNPDVALDKKIIGDWNSRVRDDWNITPDSRRGHPELAHETGGSSTGDALLSAYDIARSQFVPHGMMPADVRKFAQAWEAWKRSVDAIDYSDMILLALERAIDGERAPGNPEVLISDEAQDMTPAEIALVLAWGAHAGRTVFALDDDQAIMNWRGGDADPILALGVGLDGGPQPDAQIEDLFLDQSHRIPASVHAIAQSWIEHCTHRQKKDYRPRAVDGQCYAVMHPIESMTTAKAIARDAYAGRSVMVLAACEYMLRPLIANLRALGVPFGNSYRPTEGRWNPLRGAQGMTTAERLFRYLVMDDQALGGWTRDGGRARLWTGDDVRAWLPLVRADAGLVRGAKTAVSLLPAGELSVAQVEGLFAATEEGDAALARATEPDLAWLRSAVLDSKREALRYPAAIAEKYGPAALVDKPLVEVGTIHSFKGGQADVTYLSPSLSSAGYAEWLRGGVPRDQVIRQFYVGLTRSIQAGIVLGSSERCVPRAMLCPVEMQVR